VVQGGLLQRAFDELLRLSGGLGHRDDLRSADGNTEPGELQQRGGSHTTRGGYTGSASPYSTFDQGGNVYEWNETLFPGARRGSRGGAYNSSSSVLGAAVSNNFSPTDENQFRRVSHGEHPRAAHGPARDGGLLALAARRPRRT
jgi:formylglycine-generating enzyme required for sulfatase activity